MAKHTPTIDSTIDVVTPENISFAYQLAGPFRRWPAFAIDFALRFAIMVAATIILTITGVTTSGELMFAIWLLLWFVLEWFYGGILETYWNGQTVGKRMFRMRVLRIDGQPINGMQAVMRNFLRLADMMPLIPLGAFAPDMGQDGPWAIPTCMLGLLVPMFNRRFQRLGDLVCGTMVVVEERAWMAATAKMDDPRIAQLADDLPGTMIVTRKMSQALATYVERRRYLSPPRRAEIARYLAEPLIAKWNLAPAIDHDLLICALYHRTFVGLNAQAGLASPAEFGVVAVEGVN